MKLIVKSRRSIQDDILSSPVPNSEHASVEDSLEVFVILVLNQFFHMPKLG